MRKSGCHIIVYLPVSMRYEVVWLALVHEQCTSTYGRISRTVKRTSIEELAGCSSVSHWSARKDPPLATATHILIHRHKLRIQMSLVRHILWSPENMFTSRCILRLWTEQRWSTNDCKWPSFHPWSNDDGYDMNHPPRRLLTSKLCRSSIPVKRLTNYIIFKRV